MNRTGRALIDTGTAIDAEPGINLCFSFFHPDRCSRADIHAGFAPGAEFRINHCRHAHCTPAGSARCGRMTNRPAPARIRRSPPASASAAKSSAAPPGDPASPQAVNLRLLNRSLRGGLARLSSRAALCQRLRRLDAPAHTPPGHRPHASGPSTIKSWHFFFPLLVYITHMRLIL